MTENQINSKQLTEAAETTTNPFYDVIAAKYCDIEISLHMRAWHNMQEVSKNVITLYNIISSIQFMFYLHITSKIQLHHHQPALAM